MLITSVTVEVSEDCAAAASGAAGSPVEKGTAAQVFKSVEDSRLYDLP